MSEAPSRTTVGPKLTFRSRAMRVASEVVTTARRIVASGSCRAPRRPRPCPGRRRRRPCGTARSAGRRARDRSMFQAKRMASTRDMRSSMRRPSVTELATRRSVIGFRLDPASLRTARRNACWLDAAEVAGACRARCSPRSAGCARRRQRGLPVELDRPARREHEAGARIGGGGDHLGAEGDAAERVDEEENVTKLHLDVAVPGCGFPRTVRMRSRARRGRRRLTRLPRGVGDRLGGNSRADRNDLRPSLDAEDEHRVGPLAGGEVARRLHVRVGRAGFGHDVGESDPTMRKLVPPPPMGSSTEATGTRSSLPNCWLAYHQPTRSSRRGTSVRKRMT